MSIFELFFFVVVKVVINKSGDLRLGADDDLLANLFRSKISTFDSRNATFLSSMHNLELRSANLPEQLMLNAFKKSVILQIKRQESG